MYRAEDIAKHLLVKASDDDDPLTNLKLQKLLYYAQGFHLAFNNNQPLFSEPIEAWNHGPVVPVIYHHYKKYGAEIIPVPARDELIEVDEDTRDLLDEVYQVYAQFSASGLRNMTHQEPPWKETPTRQTISHKLMFDYFKTRILDTD